jgi:hypothetical protein
MHNFLKLLSQFFENLEFWETKKALLAEMSKKNLNNKMQFLDDIKSYIKRLFR